jgi:hypothetical protein
VQRTIRSAALVVVTAIITAGNLRGVARAAAPANAAQAKPAGPATADACSLLTKQSATAALGEAVSGPKSTRLADAGSTVSSCEYTGSGIHRVHLNLMQLPPDQAAVYKALCAQKGREGLSGLGDVACWYNQKHEELQVLKGASFFSVELRRSGDPTEAIKGVAKTVFDQLR